jgi:hypothetical protein
MNALYGWYVAAIRPCNLSFLARKFLQLAVRLSDMAKYIVLTCSSLIWVNNHDIYTLLQAAACNPCAVPVLQFWTGFASCDQGEIQLCSCTHFLLIIVTILEFMCIFGDCPGTCAAKTTVEFASFRLQTYLYFPMKVNWLCTGSTHFKLACAHLGVLSL